MKTGRTHTPFIGQSLAEWHLMLALTGHTLLGARG